MNLQRPIYRCDKAVALDCEPEEMWDVGEEKPWIDSIRRVVNSHIQLDSKGKTSIHTVIKREDNLTSSDS